MAEHMLWRWSGVLAGIVAVVTGVAGVVAG